MWCLQCAPRMCRMIVLLGGLLVLPGLTRAQPAELPAEMPAELPMSPVSPADSPAESPAVSSVSPAESPVEQPSTMLEADVRAGYGGSLRLQDRDDRRLRSGLDVGLVELELRWLRAWPSGRGVGLRVLLGVGVGKTRGFTVEWDDDDPFDWGRGDRDTERLDGGLGVRAGVAVGPVFRRAHDVAWGPLLHLDMVSFLDGHWTNHGSAVVQTRSRHRFGVGAGLGMTFRGEAQVGLGFQVGSLGRGGPSFTWRLTIGFGTPTQRKPSNVWHP